MNSCIRIVKEDNSKPYLFYEQSGYWNVEFIVVENNSTEDKSSPNGLLFVCCKKDKIVKRIS